MSVDHDRDRIVHRLQKSIMIVRSGCSQTKIVDHRLRSLIGFWNFVNTQHWLLLTQHATLGVATDKKLTCVWWVCVPMWMKEPGSQLYTWQYFWINSCTGYFFSRRNSASTRRYQDNSTAPVTIGSTKLLIFSPHHNTGTLFWPVPTAGLIPKYYIQCRVHRSTYFEWSLIAVTCQCYCMPTKRLAMISRRHLKIPTKVKKTLMTLWTMNVTMVRMRGG